MSSIRKVSARAAALCVVLLVAVPQVMAQARKPPESLSEARKGFVTQPRPSQYQPDEPVPAPPKGVYDNIRYRSPAGELVAVLSPDPKDGKKHPAIVWCHGGFGGIGDYYWSPQPATNDQTPKPFLDAGFVVMIPAWRGENDNPGRFEMFLGESDDVLAAVDHVRALPYVDTNRIYVVGHSSGGTVALLAAMTDSADKKIRCAISFGGVLDCRSMRNGWEPMIPFDPADEREMRVRSPIEFVPTLRVPTWYIEGKSSANGADVPRLAKAAAASATPLRATLIDGGDHFDILRPLNKLLAQQLAKDTGPQFAAEFNPKAMQAAFEAEHAERARKRRAMPLVKLKPAAVAEIKDVIKQQRLKPDKTWLTIDPKGKLDLAEKFDGDTQVEVKQDGIQIALPKDLAERLRGLVIDFKKTGAEKGFTFDRDEE